MHYGVHPVSFPTTPTWLDFWSLYSTAYTQWNVSHLCGKYLPGVVRSMLNAVVFKAVSGFSVLMTKGLSYSMVGQNKMIEDSVLSHLCIPVMMNGENFFFSFPFLSFFPLCLLEYMVICFDVGFCSYAGCVVIVFLCPVGLLDKSSTVCMKR